VANKTQFFDYFDGSAVLTSYSDAYISRSVDFRADDRQNRLLYPLRMRGVTKQMNTIGAKPSAL
jgi:hypothetical protein